MTTTRTISNSDDVIDSRDVIARIEELESERDTALETHRDEWDDEHAGDEQAAEYDASTFTFDDQDELDALKKLAEQAEGYASDWTHGETLIADSHFEDYARQLADDLGVIDSDARWPTNCIDWEQAARELQTDYTSVDFDGQTYWVR